MDCFAALAMTEIEIVIPGCPLLGAGPESILTIVVMDSGFVLRTPRSDEAYTNPPPSVTRRRW